MQPDRFRYLIFFLLAVLTGGVLFVVGRDVWNRNFDSLPNQHISPTAPPPTPEPSLEPTTLPTPTPEVDTHLLFPVTKERSIDRYAPQDLVDLTHYPGQSLRREAAEAFDKMVVDAGIAGIEVGIRSTYRSYDIQVGLYATYEQQYGDEANTFSAKAGHSEHQLGTAIDFGTHPDFDFTAAFLYTDLGTWLNENAHNYGFVMSYPEGSEEVTGYIFEPWHYRYVGTEHATKVKSEGLVLQEYLEGLPMNLENEE